METLQVQSGGAVAPALSVSTALSGASAGDDSFALTLGRALENMPVQAGSSITPKAPPAPSRGKGAAGDSSDSSSLAGSNCFVSHLVQPIPTVALSTKAPECPTSLPSTESTSDSPPNLDLSVHPSEGQTSANSGAISIPAATGEVAEPSTLSPGAGKGIGPVGTAKPEASRTVARARGQGAIPSGGLVSTPGQDQSKGTPSSQPESAQAWLPGLQDNSSSSQNVEQKVGGALSESKPLPASSPWSKQESGSQKSPSSSSFAGPWPRAQLDLGQVQAAPPPPSSRDLQAASNPLLPLGQTGQAAPVSGSEASDSSTPLNATNHPALAEFSSQLGMFAGAEVQTASSPTPSAGQAEQTAPASGSEASGSSTPLTATDYPALAEFSSRPGRFAGAEVQAAPSPTPSAGQARPAAPAYGAEASDSSTPLYATSHSALAEFSNRLGLYAGAEVQTASSPAPPAGQTEPAAPVSGSEASGSSTPLITTDHPALAEISSRRGNLTDAKINREVSASKSRPVPVPEESSTASAPVAADALSRGLHMTGEGTVQIPAAPKSERLVNNLTKGAIPSAQLSSSATTDAAWQKGNELEAANAGPPLSSSARPVPPQQPDANSQPVAPATILQKDAAPEANGSQSIEAVSTDSGESAGHASPSDPSMSGQGKSGQQSGPGSRDNPPGVKTFTLDLANNPAADSTANLFTAHTPGFAASHTNTSAPQTEPSSSQPPTALSAWQNYDGGAGKIVRSASLSDSANGAEMHLELRSGALGPLEVHAVVHEGSVGAEIHVQGQEAHTLLAAGLPSLERALGERNLRVENIAVYQDQAGGGMTGGEKQDPQSGSSPTPQHPVLPWDNPPQSNSAASNSSEGEEIANPATGLSVRA